jgi:hypothetical protein
MMLAAQRSLFTGSFNPLSLSPALWLSDTGSNAGQWDDLSGNGRHATQATAANQPAIVTGALNGRQVRRFDGINDFLKTGAFSQNIPQPNDWFIAFKSNNNSNGRVFDVETIGGATGPRNTMWLNGSNSHIFAGTILTGNFTNTSWNISNARFNGSNSEWRVNGLVLTNGNAGTEASSSLVIGSFRTAAASFFNGDIAEILVFPTALSILDRRRVEVYLSQKWGIPIVSDDEFFIQSLSPALWLSDTGSNPAQWDDLSGNGRHATQATAANQPAIVTGALNGRQVRRFDGVDDRLNVNSLASVFATNDPPISIFVVSRQTQSGGINRQMLMMSSSDFNTFMLLRGGGGVFRYGQRDQSLNIKFVTSTKAGDTAWNVHSVTSSGVSASIFTNGANSQTGDVDVGTMNNLSLASIGINPVNLADAWIGDIAEILVFPTALSTENRRRIEGYLSSKYAIAIS